MSRFIDSTDKEPPFDRGDEPERDGDDVRRPTAADYRGVSPGFVRVVRWVNRIVYLFMILATIAAISYATGKSNDLERKEAEVKSLRDRVGTLQRDLAKPVEADPAAPGEKAAKPAGLSQESLTALAALAEANDRAFESAQQVAELRAEVRRLNAEVQLKERHTAVLQEQFDSRRAADAGMKPVTPDVKPVPGAGAAKPVAQPESPAIDAAWAKLAENLGDRKALVNVAAELFNMKDGAAVLAWLKARSTPATANAVLTLIGIVAPAGGDGLARWMLTDALSTDAAIVAAGPYLDAAGPYRGSEDSNELLVTIATRSTFSAPDRAQAVVLLAWGGDARAERYLASSWRELPAGAPERVSLAAVAAVSQLPGHLVTAEMALEETASTAEEIAAGQRAFRAVAHCKTATVSAAGKTRLSSVIARAAGLPEARLAALKALLDELYPKASNTGATTDARGATGN